MTDAKPPFSPLPQKPPATDVERREDGSVLIWSRHSLADIPSNLAAIFRERSEAHPDRSFLLQRKPGHGPWTGVTWAEVRAATDSIAQWLIDHDFSQNDPVMVISGNSLMSQDHEKLLHYFSKIGAKAVFAKEGELLSAALARLREAAPDLVVVTCDGKPEAAVDYAGLRRLEPTLKVDERVAAIDADTVGKFLFTSGSTGLPKCVPQTHGMMITVIAGQEGLAEESRDDRNQADCFQ